MTEEKQGFHYAWLILIGCCVSCAGSFALLTSLMGVYMVPASTGMGLSIPEFTMWSSAVGITQIFTFPMWGQLVRKHFKICYLIGALCMAIGIFCFSFANSVPQLIIIGIVLGIGQPITFFLPPSLLINNWFASKHRGKMLGIATAFSGVGTFVWAPVFTMIIEAVGYQMSYRINAILCLVLLIPWVFVFKFSPEEKGLKPYGWTPEEEIIAKNAEGANKAGISASKAFATPAFWLLFVCILAAAIGMGFNNAQRVMAGEMLGGIPEAAMIGAMMISTAAVGNILGKIAIGFLADKVGIKVAVIIFLVLFFLCFVLWLVFPGQLWAMYIGAFLLGTHNGITTVAFPRIARTLFGGYDYDKIWSRLSIAASILCGFSSTLVTSIATGVGTYMGIQFLGVGMVLVIIVAIFAIGAMAFIGKVKWDHSAEEAA